MTEMLELPLVFPPCGTVEGGTMASSSGRGYPTASGGVDRYKIQSDGRVIVAPSPLPATRGLLDEKEMTHPKKQQRHREMDKSPSVLPFPEPTQQFARGMASVSVIGESRMIYTTSPLPEDASVLCVTAIPPKDEREQDTGVPLVSALIQFDLTEITGDGKPLVAVKICEAREQYATDSLRGHEKSIALIMVNRNAAIIRVALHATTLQPLGAALTYATGNSIPNDWPSPVILPSMVHICNDSRLILGLNPCLCLVDLNTRQTVIWSRKKTLQEMKNRSFLTRLASTSRELVVGRTDPRSLYDMHPVSALCVCEDQHVFTLHTDGQVRHWILPPDKAEPWQVEEPSLSVSPIPPSTLWDVTDPYAVNITARLYGQVYALCIHVKAHTVPATNSNRRSQSHLIVFDGPADVGSASDTNVVTLQNPEHDVVAIAFDPGQSRCTLRVLLDSGDWIVYGPSSLSMVSSKYQVVNDALLLSHVAKREKEKWQAAPLESWNKSCTMEAIDEWFLRLLFRPTAPRGTGNTIPPSPRHIQRALYKRTRQVNTSISLQVACVKAMYMVPPRTLALKGIVPQTPIRNGQSSSQQISLYDSVAKRVRPSTTTSIVNTEQSNTSYIEGVHHHEQRWRSFVTDIWELESVERTPLAMHILQNGHAVVVRASCIAIVRPLQKRNILKSINASSLERFIEALIATGPVNSESRDQIIIEISNLASDTSISTDLPRPDHDPFPALHSSRAVGISALNWQHRLAAASLAIRRVDYQRQVLLQHCMVNPVPRIVRDCLFATTAQWVAAQEVSMRFPKGDTSIQGSNNTVLMSPYEKTTSLNSLLIHLAESLPVLNSLEDTFVGLASAAVTCMLGQVENHSLPELAAIPPQTLGSVTDDPHLAARLLTLPRIQSPKHRQVLAECFLILNKEIDTAIQLLPFHPDDIETSLKHLDMLFHHLSGSSHENDLTQYIRNAIDVAPDNHKLWSTLFGTSLTFQRWDKAFEAAMNVDDPRNALQRLARSMVDAGALQELLNLCTRLDSNIDKAMQVKAVVSRTDFYSLCALSLCAPDWYSHRAADPTGIVSDYHGALYSLRISQGDYKAAAECLHFRVCLARAELQKGAPVLSPEARHHRDTLIVDDLILSSLGSILALKQVNGVSSEYLSLGARVTLSPANGLSGFNSPSFCVSNGELMVQAVACIAMKNLFFARMQVCRPLAVKALAEFSCDLKFDECIDMLFASGFYHSGIQLAKAQRLLIGRKPEGHDLLTLALCRLLGSYLVPLASGEVCTNRPTLQQLLSGVEILDGRHESRLCLQYGSHLPSLPTHAVRIAAETLCHMLTTKYSTSDWSIAADVAEYQLNSSRMELSSWLEHVLIHGKTTGIECGLFAKRRHQGSPTQFLGDPSALLSLYTKRGQLVAACRVVADSLRRLHQKQSVQASRLPEKGSMDVVPYEKIDLLWNLIELCLKEDDREDRNELLNARQQLENALAFHYEMLKISEMGLRSARVLS